MTANQTSPLVPKAQIPATAELCVRIGNDFRPATVEDLALFGYTKNVEPEKETPAEGTSSQDSNQGFTDFDFGFIFPSSAAAEKVTSFLTGLFTAPEPEEGKTPTQVGKDFYQGLADILDQYRRSGEKNDDGKSGPNPS